MRMAFTQIRPRGSIQSAAVSNAGRPEAATAIPASRSPTRPRSTLMVRDMAPGGEGCGSGRARRKRCDPGQSGPGPLH